MNFEEQGRCLACTQIVLPSTQKDAVLQQLHNQAGHLGFKKTM